MKKSILLLMIFMSFRLISTTANSKKTQRQTPAQIESCNRLFQSQDSNNNIASDQNNKKQNLQNYFSKNKPLGFKENKGQMIDIYGIPTPYVLFKVEAPNLNIWLTNTGLTYHFFKIENLENTQNIKGILDNRNAKNNRQVTEEQRALKGEWRRVDMVLKNATIKKENIIKENNITQGEENYYLGHSPNGILNIKTFSKITIKEIYKGIDWVLYTSDNNLKYDFIIHPQADPNQIKLLYEGDGQFETDNNKIHFKNEIGELSEGELYCYQNNYDNKVKAKYAVLKNNTAQYAGAGNLKSLKNLNLNERDNQHTFSYELTFTIDNYNKNNILVIDPLMVWATYFGGNDQEYSESITIDNADASIIVGSTSSHNFPVQNAGTFFQGTYSTGSNYPEILILKFSSSNALLWATYYGGSLYDEAISVTTDKLDNIYISGITSSTNFPTQDAGTFYQGVFGGGNGDGFMLKFDGIGNRLWATYYGGSDYDVLSISKSPIDNSFYVVGSSQSTDFPTQNNGGFFQATNAGGSDAVFLKFDTSGNRLWATYYGGSADDSGVSLATDGLGNIFIGGSTSSLDFPTQNAGTFFQGTGVPLGSSGTCYILKFDSNNNRVWATYYGGNTNNSGGFEQIGSVLCDQVGNLFITGFTNSIDFPVQNSGTFFQGTINGDWDTFILKFDNSGNRLWATYYGGNSTDANYSSALDECGNLFIGMGTTTSNLNTQASCEGGFLENTMQGGSGIFISEFSNMGDLFWSSYIKSVLFTVECQIALKKNNLIITSRDQSNSALPYSTNNTGSYFDNSFNGIVDLFISKFTITSTTLSINSNSIIGCTCNSAINLSVTACSPYNYNWSNGMSTLNTSSTTNTISNLCIGAYQLTVTSIPSCSSFTSNFIISPISFSLVVSSNTTITSGQSTGLFVTNSVTNFTWTPSNNLSCNTCSNPIASPLASTIYSVNALDSNGCALTNTIMVTVNELCSGPLSINLPNAFSPNGDGTNDLFCIQDGQSCISEIILIIYDRWGEKVFETSNPTFCWDGNYKNKLIDSSVFVYFANATFTNGKKIEKKGNITLIR